MFLQRLAVFPARRTEQVEVHERTEVDDLQKHPDRHIINVMRYKVTRVGIVALALAAADLHGSLDGVSARVVQARVEARDYRVAVLAPLLNVRQHPHLGEVLLKIDHSERSLKRSRLLATNVPEGTFA